MTKLAMTVLLAVRAVRAAGCGSLLVAEYLCGETESRKVWRDIQRKEIHSLKDSVDCARE
jgi:hypothetical protein